MTLITSAGQAEEELPWPTSGSAQRSTQHVTPSTAHNHVVAAMKDVIVRLLYVATRHQVQALAVLGARGVGIERTPLRAMPAFPGIFAGAWSAPPDRVARLRDIDAGVLPG